MSEKDNWKWQKKLLIKRDKEHQEEIEKLNYIIDKQDRDIVALSNGNRKLKTRIDKALEYINKHLEETEYGEVILTHTFDKHNLKELKDILGSDKE